MKKSSNTLFWLITLIVVAMGTYWFGTAQVAAPQEKTENQVVKQTSPADTTVDPIAATPEEVFGNLLYTNEKYHFTLNLPPRWKEYRVEENKDEWGDHYNFKLKLKNGQYGSVFVVSALSREVWKNIQAEEGPKAQYLSEKNAYVFTYAMGHDDDGYAGFPEVVPEITFKGPYFDVQEIIIPSFSFTK